MIPSQNEHTGIPISNTESHLGVCFLMILLWEPAEISRDAGKQAETHLFDFLFEGYIAPFLPCSLLPGLYDVN